MFPPHRSQRRVPLQSHLIILSGRAAGVGVLCEPVCDAPRHGVSYHVVHAPYVSFWVNADIFVRDPHIPVDQICMLNA
jgi:hypothetical protein